MAYIAPNSTLMICKNVPLSPSYIHTCDFESKTLQSAYFLTKAKFQLNQYSYQRKNNFIKVNLTTEQLYDCNYLAYKNTSFENKWFYAFITNIEYISNEVSAIYFEEDIYQTWLFDFNVTPCFISREHALYDEIGDNLIPENVELGEYIFNNDYALNWGGLVPVIIGGVGYNKNTQEVITDVPSLPTQTSNVMFDSLYYTICASPKEASDAIKKISDAGSIGAVISVIMLPSQFITDYGVFVGGGNVTRDYSFNKPNNIENYIPKNKKLLAYPYSYLQVSNGAGQTARLKTEYFSTNTFNFRAIMGLEPSPTLSIYPLNYKGIGVNYDETICVTNFPSCAIVTDTFKLWYAQNSILYLQAQQQQQETAEFNANMGVLRGGANTALSTAGNLATGNIIGAGASLAGGIASTAINYTADKLQGAFDHEQLVKQQIAQTKVAQLGSVTAKYTGTSGFMEYLNLIRSLHIQHISITAQYAKIIDDYFSAFGYQTNKFKIPNLTGRASWNYIKTVGSDVTGSVPQYAIEGLNKLFDNGITIWHNPAWIGDYTRNNDIIGNG